MKKKIKKWIPTEALKNVSYLSLGRFFTYPGGFLYGVFAAWILGASGYGQLVLIMAVVKTWSMFFQLPINSPLVKLIGKRLSGKSKLCNRDLIRTVFFLQGIVVFLFGLLFFAFLLFAAPLSELFRDWQTALGWYALSEILHIFRKPFGSILIAYEKFAWDSVFIVWTSFCRDFLTIGFMFLGGIQGACLGYFIGEILIIIFSCFLVLLIWGQQISKDFFTSSLKLFAGFREIYHNTRSQYVSSLFHTGYNELRQLIIGSFVGPAGVGYFNIGLKFRKFFTFLIAPVKTYLFPRLVKKWNVSRDEFFYTFRKFFYMLGPASIAVVLIFSAAAPWLVPFLYSADFVASIPLVWIMLPAFALQKIFNVFDDITFVISRQRALVTKSLIEFIAGVPLTLWLVYSYGYIGAAWALLGTVLIISCYQIYFFKSNFGWKWIAKNSKSG